ncbi:MAG: hypothetical protein AB8F74_16575, partial [Saprospiraceae bacterium]
IGVSGQGGFIGVQGYVFPTGDNNYYGTSGSVSGGSGINYGIYGLANGSGTNWAGYFVGNGKVTGNLGVRGGNNVPEAALHIFTEDLTDTDDAFRMGGSGKFVIDSPGTIGGRMTVLENGNVGFGKTDPEESIHVVNGNVRVDNGQFQSWGPISLRPDVDLSGDDEINFLANDGTLRARINNFGLTVNANSSVNGTFTTNGRSGFNQFYVDATMNIRGVAGDAGYFNVEGPDASQYFRVNGDGNVNVINNLSKGGGSFKIDHPLDPENKYLYHSFVESPDMMNVYNGNITTDANGMAVVELPEYFMELNKDYRYQLTVIGTFAQAIIKEKMANNHFTIQTNEPNVEVSWQVTGIRQDAYANKNRIPNEVDKKPEEKGFYLHPEAFGQPASKALGRLNKAMK